MNTGGGVTVTRLLAGTADTRGFLQNFVFLRTQTDSTQTARRQTTRGLRSSYLSARNRADSLADSLADSMSSSEDGSPNQPVRRSQRLTHDDVSSPEDHGHGPGFDFLSGPEKRKIIAAAEEAAAQHPAARKAAPRRSGEWPIVILFSASRSCDPIISCCKGAAPPCDG